MCVCVCYGNTNPQLLNSVDIWQNRHRLDASPLWTLDQCAIASTHCRCEFCVEMHQHVSYLHYQGVIRNYSQVHRYLYISHNHADLATLTTFFFFFQNTLLSVSCNTCFPSARYHVSCPYNSNDSAIPSAHVHSMILFVVHDDIQDFGNSLVYSF